MFTIFYFSNFYVYKNKIINWNEIGSPIQTIKIKCFIPMWGKTNPTF